MILWTLLLALALTGVLVFYTTFSWCFGADTTAEEKIGRYANLVGVIASFLLFFSGISALEIIIFKIL